MAKSIESDPRWANDPGPMTDADWANEAAMFSRFRKRGTKPEDLAGDARARYAKWLEEHPAGVEGIDAGGRE